MLTTATLLTLAMRCAPTIHPDTINDIAKTESGFHPYAIAEIVRLPNGMSRVIPHMPTSKDEALKIVEDIKKNNHRYSVGLMQITSTNFSKFKTDANSMFDPCKNLSVAEKIITDCYIRGGTLKRALSCYYSGNFNTGQEPEKHFKGTSYTERIGYTVPSTKEEQRHFKDLAESNKTIAPVIKWPNLVVRGDLTSSPERPTNHIKYPSRIVRGSLSIN